jgi:hypothetical protein
MARKKYTSKSSRYTKGRKTSKGPRRPLKKSKPTEKKFTQRQIRAYVQAVRESRGDSEE